MDARHFLEASDYCITNFCRRVRYLIVIKTNLNHNRIELQNHLCYLYKIIYL